jgi:hypothetical protein
MVAITNEEDFFEAKLLHQALPDNAPERARLRGKILDYLLAPIAALDAEQLRRTPSPLGSEDDFDRLQDSFRDALDLFPPSALWAAGGPQLSDARAPACAERGQGCTGGLFPARQRAARGDRPVRPRIHRRRQWGMGLPTGPALFLARFRCAARRRPARSAPPGFAQRYSGKRRRGLAGARGGRAIVSPGACPPGQGGGHLEAPHRLGRRRAQPAQRAAARHRIALGHVGVRSGHLPALRAADQANQVAEHFADKPGDDPEFRQLTRAAASPQAKVPESWRWPGGSCHATRSCVAHPPIASIQPLPWAFCARDLRFAERPRPVAPGLAGGAHAVGAAAVLALP